MCNASSSTEGCQEAIRTALNLLLCYGESCRSLAEKCFVSRNTLNGIKHVRIPKKNRQEVFTVLMKQLKAKYNEAFKANDYDKAGALKHWIYVLMQDYLGI